MNKSVKIVLGVTVLSLIGFGLVALGIMIGRSGWTPYYSQRSAFQMPMFSGFRTDTCVHSGSTRGGRMGEYGMMGEYISKPNAAVQPLTIDEADQIIQEYLKDLSNDDLMLGEIMIFDNQAYAEILEKSSGVGAMEVLIDPTTRLVYPEQGPNMMWNLKYSPMGNSGKFGGPGMMSGSNGAEAAEFDINTDDLKNMPVSGSQAVKAAQDYLDQYRPGTQADEHVDTFYGYYTIHTLSEGNVIGMLSVNGFSGQVFYHDWHGDFIEMSED